MCTYKIGSAVFPQHSAWGFVNIFAWRLVWHIWTLFLKLIAATKLYLARCFCSLYLCITPGTKLAWQSVRIIFHYAQLIKIVACSTWHATRLSGPCFPIALAHSTVGQSFVLPNALRMHQRQKLYERILNCRTKPSPSWRHNRTLFERKSPRARE